VVVFPALLFFEEETELETAANKEPCEREFEEDLERLCVSMCGTEFALGCDEEELPSVLSSPFSSFFLVRRKEAMYLRCRLLSICIYLPSFLFSPFVDGNV
jgi:hypothetical protein